MKIIRWSNDNQWEYEQWLSADITVIVLTCFDMFWCQFLACFVFSKVHQELGLWMLKPQGWVFIHEQDQLPHVPFIYLYAAMAYIYIYKYVYWLCLLIITNQICTISVLYISLNAEVSYKIPVARGSKELSRVVSELFRLASLASLTDFYNINTPFVSFGLI